MEKQRLRPLVEAFVWPLMFFDTCNDDLLDPDVAVQQMENISAALDDLDAPLRGVVVQILEDLARESHRPEVRDWLQATPRALGWLDEEEPSAG